MKVEAVVLGSPSLIVLMVSVDVKQTELGDRSELRSCEQGGGPILSFPTPLFPRP